MPQVFVDKGEGDIKESIQQLYTVDTVDYLIVHHLVLHRFEC